MNWMENVETQTNNKPTTEENGQETSNEEDFAELVESSFQTIHEGEVVTGTVVQVTPESVMIDVGSKAEGQVPIHEFCDDEGNLTPAHKRALL